MRIVIRADTISQDIEDTDHETGLTEEAYADLTDVLADIGLDLNEVLRED